MRAPSIAASLLVLAVLAGSCAAAPPPPAPPAPAAAPRPPPGVPDRELGLSHTSVFDVPSPPSYKDEDGSPGEKPLPPRISTEIPPVIPHAIGDFLPITRESNGCAACHEVAGPKKPGEATPIPASHYVDRRRLATEPGKELAGARWVCTACHAARTDAAPLVVSGFKP